MPGTIIAGKSPTGTKTQYNTQHNTLAPSPPRQPQDFFKLEKRYKVMRPVRAKPTAFRTAVG